MQYFEEISDKTLDLGKLSNQNFVLYFYPKDNTSGCTLEALEFSELYHEFVALGYHIYGISKDTVGSHLKFKEKNNIPFELISDPERVLLNRFEVVKEKKMYGKAVKGTERSTFIFKKDFELIKSFRNVKAQGHAKEVLEYIKENS